MEKEGTHEGYLANGGERVERERVEREGGERGWGERVEREGGWWVVYNDLRSSFFLYFHVTKKTCEGRFFITYLYIYPFLSYFFTEK